MNSRQEVLARVRRASADAQPPIVPRTYLRAGTVSPDLEVFADRLRDYRAEVHRCDTAGLPDLLETVLQGRVLVPPGFPAAWSEELRADLVHDDMLSPEALDGLDVVVTTCALAITETGTVVLDAGPGQGRRALSLVPDRHVIVVRVGQLVATVPDALARLDPTRPQTWISGPSATSDIELQRVEGVHGPRSLVVVLLDH